MDVERQTDCATRRGSRSTSITTGGGLGRASSRNAEVSHQVGDAVREAMRSRPATTTAFGQVDGATISCALSPAWPGSAGRLWIQPPPRAAPEHTDASRVLLSVHHGPTMSAGGIALGATMVAAHVAGQIRSGQAFASRLEQLGDGQLACHCWNSAWIAGAQLGLAEGLVGKTSASSESSCRWRSLAAAGTSTRTCFSCPSGRIEEHRRPARSLGSVAAPMMRPWGLTWPQSRGQFLALVEQGVVH